MRLLSASSDFQMSLAQNNPCSEVVTGLGRHHPKMPPLGTFNISSCRSREMAAAGRTLPSSPPLGQVLRLSCERPFPYLQERSVLVSDDRDAKMKSSPQALPSAP